LKKTAVLNTFAQGPCG